jgi:hypothetical protein
MPPRIRAASVSEWPAGGTIGPHFDACRGPKFDWDDRPAPVKSPGGAADGSNVSLTLPRGAWPFALIGAAILLLLPAWSEASAATCGGKRATIVGTPGNDVIVGK